MSKLPSIITLAVAAAFLAACSLTPANEPEARPAVASESAPPSVVPTDEDSTPEPEVTQPGETAEPIPESTPEPSEEPTPEGPQEPAPDLEPLPAGPNDPFVPPPHGEPNPYAPVTPGIPGVPHSDPAYFENVTVEPVTPGDYTPATVIQQGATMTVIGSGYAPGQEIHVTLGWPGTDYNYIAQPIAYADEDGAFSFAIVIGTNVPPRDYVVMTAPGAEDPDKREMLKRYAKVHIVARTGS